MDNRFEGILENYAELILKIGLNFQEGQRLNIGTVSELYRVPFDAAPLVRKVVKKAYEMGASLVEVFWGDEELTKIRCENANLDTLGQYPTWIAHEVENTIHRSDAQFIIGGENPNLLAGVDPERIGMLQKARAENLAEVMELADQNPSNWTAACYPMTGWAASVFPNLSNADSVSTLWEYIIQSCRLDLPDPLEFWQKHLDELNSRAQKLTQAQYKSLQFKSPDTELSMDLPSGHIWFGGRVALPNGLEFCPNLPTEEVCTLPDRSSVKGFLRATKPFIYRGMTIDGMRMVFEDGKVVEATANVGEDTLNNILQIDDGACRLGEVALVPHSSPISQSGVLFRHGLYDENASSHLALGRAYRFCLTDGEEMDKDEFVAAGGNFSTIHIDFMIGSEDMDVDGLKQDGTAVPLMRAGEWAFNL